MKKETPEQKKKRTEKIFAILKKKYKSAKIALTYSNPLQLLIAVMLSAQCTDKRVNIVTPVLFKRYGTAKDFAEADIKELESLVRSAGFYHNKAANIKKSCQMILEEFNGKVPDTMEGIMELPGVARKTANIVVGNAYGIIEGIAVDTHVGRLSQRMGFSNQTNPEKIEKDLMEIVPKKEWLSATYYLIEHGRAVCKAPTPSCSICPLLNLCPRTGVSKSK